MKPLPRLARTARLFLVVSLASMLADLAHGQAGEATNGVGSSMAAAADLGIERKKEERREFQLQELMLAKSGGWIFKPGETPRVLWRDIETVRQLGCTEALQVRWFNAELEVSPQPDAPGRWLAWIEGTAPNGTPLRRLRTFYALPEQIPTSIMPKLTVALPNLFSPDVPAVVREHEAEIVRLANEALVRTVMGNEQGAILVAGLTEIESLGRPATYIESTDVRNDDVNLALKLKLQGLQDEVRSLRPQVADPGYTADEGFGIEPRSDWRATTTEGIRLGRREPIQQDSQCGSLSGSVRSSPAERPRKHLGRPFGQTVRRGCKVDQRLRA